MAVSINNFKCAGVIYDITEIEYTKKGNFPFRFLVVEVPSSPAGMQKTSLLSFKVMFEETESLDWYKKGEWVEVLFLIDGREWVNPETQKPKYFSDLKIIDIHKGENPFEKAPEEISQDPDDLSPDHLNELATNVKDWSNQPVQKDIFDQEPDDLPF